MIILEDLLFRYIWFEIGVLIFINILIMSLSALEFETLQEIDSINFKENR